jgi:prepilin-type processing-associated H-X9-DG protein
VRATEDNATIKINDVEFRHYYARDEHGAVCNLYFVDGHVVDVSEFMKEMRRLFKPMNNLIFRAADGNDRCIK